jgi:small-conductance mechanosensitive channel
MKNFLLSLIKPKGSYAKWLVFLALILIAILGTLGYFQIVRQYLDTELLTFGIGTYQISLYELLRALTTVVFVFWLAAIVSDFAENRIGKLSGLRAANRALAMKIAQISIYVIAFLVALDFVGIDLTTLTIFSGALGIGLGFGLQKIASNFISGLILLFEKSVEIGDLVELADGTYGFIRKSSARFTLIETFESKEILVPNEDLITSRVTNWTYTNSQGRSEIKIGVSYKSDIEKARELILEAARAHSRCSKEPVPKCYLRGYGDSSVDFVLHYWVDDVTLGRWEPESDILFSIWRKFKDNDIEIPFPQRDLHLRSPEIIQVKDNENK